MRATTIHAPGDIRFEEVPDPRIEEPTDAIVKVVAGCICGSDLWPYRGHNDIDPGSTIGHECVGVVEEVGSDVRDIRTGDFVIVPFDHCDNTCAHCRAGAHSECDELGFTESGQAEYSRVTQADGSLVATDGMPDDALIPSLLTLSDVMATGWHAAVAAGVRPGGTAVVVGDGAVGLCGVLAAAQLGAERVIAMSRHEPRQELARRFGATDIVAERGKEGAERVAELTGGVGADAVLDCVGGTTWERAPEAVRDGGRLCTLILTELPERPPRGLELRTFGTSPDRHRLTELAGLLDAGELRVALAEAMPLTAVRTAHERFEAGGLHGKLALLPDH